MTELERLRHSAAHVLATAVLKLWPEAQLAAGPPVENGFYYDIEMPHRISPEDFPKIEEEMKKEIKANHAFERKVVSRDEAIALCKSGHLGALSPRNTASKFKLDILQGIPEGEEISLYQNGDFLDLCAGPHVMRTGNIGAFKLTHVASAYYKGDEKNPQLQRIYGTAFKTKKEMDEYFAMLEEAKKRDHRKLGRELEIFVFDDDVGPGLPLWLPNGAVMIEELERLAKETEFKHGYVRVRTPHIARDTLFKTSGHLPYYEDSMFPAMRMSDRNPDEQGSYYLKAMNCPHHHKLYAALPRSYRDLPLRFAEYGTCYRYEQSGELFGLMRVRSMQMNDSHIYCTEDQFESEFLDVIKMYLDYYKLFGIEKYLMRFSTHEPSQLGQKYVNEPELWKKTEDMVRRVMRNNKINFVEVANEAAFYGPKIDVQIWSIIGREFTIATNQVDFAQPRRFELEYTTSQNTKATPLCIHRAPLSTHERMIGFLIEHYAGAFPVWLAPEQVRLCPVTDTQNEYARKLEKEMRDKYIRVTVDDSREKLGAKIRLAQLAKVPYMLILGEKEVQAHEVAVRSRKVGDEGSMPWQQFFTRLQSEIAQRRA